MNTDFSKVMSQRSDDELLNIVNKQKKDYQSEAVIAAYNELLSRNLSKDQHKLLSDQLELFISEKDKISFLSEIQKCPICNNDIELNIEERVKGKFFCHSCNKKIDSSQTIKMLETPESLVEYLSENEECPYCENKVELSPEERLKGIFICSKCNKPVDFSNKIKTTNYPQDKKIEEIGKISVKKDLRNWGIGLIILGIIYFFIGETENIIFGSLIIVLGGTSILYANKIMFILIGILLLLVGILNIVVGAFDLSFGWVVFGILQLGWAANEFRKYKRYSKLNH